jgi:hypothetical protein
VRQLHALIVGASRSCGPGCIVAAFLAAAPAAGQERHVEVMAQDAKTAAAGIKAPEAEPATPPSTRPDLLIVPIPQSNPMLGTGLTVAAVLFYNPNKSSQPWISGVGGMYTSNKSWGALAFHSMSLAHDRFRVLAVAGYGDVNVDFYGIGPNAGDRNASIELENKSYLGLVQAQYRVAKGLYVGARYEYLNIDTRIETDQPVFPGLDIPQPELRSKVSALGPAITYDTRDSSLNPGRGAYLTAVGMFNLHDLGSDFDYQKTQLAANGYFSATRGGTFAIHGSLCATSTGGPYYDLCMFGANSDLRGYEAGRYRDRASWAMQAELRQHLGGRFGAVFFAGIGGIAPDIGSLGDTKLLPSAGMGLRYRASKSTGVNLRLDFAIGNDSNAVYFGIGEAF